MPSVILFCKVADGMGCKEEGAHHNTRYAYNIREHFLHAKLLIKSTGNALKQKISADH